jgi:hypothetical protein
LDYFFPLLDVGIVAIVGTTFVFHDCLAYGALFSASWRSAHSLW